MVEGEAEGEEGKEKAATQYSTATSVFQNFTVFRDFFLAAFSDGYNVCLQGESRLFALFFQS